MYLVAGNSTGRERLLPLSKKTFLILKRWMSPIPLSPQCFSLLGPRDGKAEDPSGEAGVQNAEHSQPVMKPEGNPLPQGGHSRNWGLASVILNSEKSAAFWDPDKKLKTRTLGKSRRSYSQTFREKTYTQTNQTKRPIEPRPSKSITSLVPMLEMPPF